MPIEEDGASKTVGRSRRSWTVDEKRRIVEESLIAGASIAEVARRHDLNANQLFTWRRQLGVQPTAPHELAPILPVTIEPEIPRQRMASASQTVRWRSFLLRAIGSSFGLM